VLKSPHKSLLVETGAGAGVVTGTGESKSKRISEHTVRNKKKRRNITILELKTQNVRASFVCNSQMLEITQTSFLE
jgi:hypothetical protein